MASDTCCFDSPLFNLECAKKMSSSFDFKCSRLICKIRYLRIFHECATKWGNDDASLRALLLRIEDAVSKIALGVGDYWPYNFESFEDSRSFRNHIKDAHRRIGSFEKEINEWCIKFSDCSSQSCSQDSDEVEEFIGSLLGTLEFLLGTTYEDDSGLIYLLDALKDNLIFLKNFIRFAKLRGGIDHDIHLGQNLITHIKAVAICVAHHCYMYRITDDEVYTGDMVDDDEDDTDDHNDEDEDKDDTDDKDIDEKDDEDDTDDMVDEDGTDDHNDEDDTDDEDKDDKDGEDGTDEMVDEDSNPGEHFNIAELLQRIKPVDPHVYQTYIQALNVSKLSRQLHIPTPEIMGDFISSLLFYLFEILRDDTNLVLSTKNHQLHILYEGLRSLRTILKKQPKNFDEEIWDLIRVVVCDAGFVIFSLFPDAIEDGFAQKMDSLLSDLLERVKFIRAKVFGESSTFNFPKVDELGFIDFVLEKLRDQLSNFEETAGSTVIPKHQIQTIYEELVFFKSFLENTVLLRDEQEEIQTLWNRVVEFAYRMEFLIDTLVIGGVPDDSYLPMSFDSITREINNIKWEALKISNKEGIDKVTKKSNNLLPLERSKPEIKDKIVGFSDVISSIKTRLQRGTSQLQIVGIVGMAGQGKTTLAKMIYNDHSIVPHFHVLAWCCISQVYNKKNMLLEILTCISSGLPTERSYEVSEEDLALELYQKLKRRKYLIVLDDMWDIDAWNSLRESFPNDGIESRILLTSRHQNVVDKLDREAYFLRQLTDDESRELLKTKLLPRHDWPPNLCELRTQIVKMCKGLPLTIVITANILANIEEDGWKEVVKRLSSSTTPILEQCMNTLEMSYTCLPDKLKPCLLYFGAFPEDQELTPNQLTWLWIAEGFVHKTKSQSLEDEAKDYLKQLINRSLVTIDKRSSIGSVKTCRIHDLLHEFCVKKAKEESFFQLLQENDELSSFDEPYKVYRLSIHSKAEHFKESRLFCPRTRSMLFFRSDNRFEKIYFNLLLCFRMSKFVKVLNLSQILLGNVFPSEIGLLVQLSYLEVGGSFRSIPSSIANLSNLETLIMHTSGSVDLPHNIWNLKKLRHLRSHGFGSGFCLPYCMDNSAVLCNLDTFSVLDLKFYNLEEILKKFPNIRKLKFETTIGSAGSSRSRVLLVFNHFSQLESLNIINNYDNSPQKLQAEVCFPSKLRKLTLGNICLPWSNMSAIGNLPNLVVLKLFYHAFEGEDWNMKESGQFPKLEFLKLSRLGIIRWTVSESMEDPFPSLVKLVLESCYRLEEVPSCLKDSASLQMIEVSRCSNSVVSSIEQIRKEQEDMGNVDFKVLFHYSDTGDS